MACDLVALNALTVDLEEYFQVSNFEKHIERADWDELPSRVIESTHRLLDLCEADPQLVCFSRSLVRVYTLPS